MANKLSYEEFVKQHEEARRKYCEANGLDYYEHYHIKPQAEEPEPQPEDVRAEEEQPDAVREAGSFGRSREAQNEDAQPDDSFDAE
ncbi:MAG: hypothetical protein J6U63_00325, partial [Clostridia bacterium]|nr:hypothetical protein [Clostridia bacterium]